MALLSHILTDCLSINFGLIFKNEHQSGFSFSKLNQKSKSLLIRFIPVNLAFALILMSFPLIASAGVFSFIASLINCKTAAAESKSISEGSQKLAVLKALRTPDPEQGRGGGDITIVGGSSLMPESGPVGTIANVSEGMTNGTINVYVVRKGDNLSVIAKMFGVSVNTIIWANDIKGSVIREGQTLVILPISGVEHTVAKGDTIQSIAKKYKADTYDISVFNNIDLDAKLAIGDTIIIPDGEIATPAPTVSTGSNTLRGVGGPDMSGYYMRPITGGSKSQGLHGYNGVDLATYAGAPISSAAGGQVIVVATGGWNGGYGNYVVVAHPNGTQTLYAHNSKNLVSVGDQVVKGQTIALVGSTGKSTGSHLHF